MKGSASRVWMWRSARSPTFMTGFFRSKADTKAAHTCKSASFLTSGVRSTRSSVCRPRNFFLVGGLDLTARVGGGSTGCQRTCRFVWRRRREWPDRSSVKLGVSGYRGRWQLDCSQGLQSTEASMNILRRVVGRWRPRRPRYALALAGGGVIGGRYEVGVIAAIEERVAGAGDFDIYVGCSAGSVVASLLANGVRASEVYRIIDQDLEHPMNFRRGAVYASNSFRHAAGRFGRLLWAVGKNAM